MATAKKSTTPKKAIKKRSPGRPPKEAAKRPVGRPPSKKSSSKGPAKKAATKKPSKSAAKRPVGRPPSKKSATKSAAPPKKAGRGPGKNKLGVKNSLVNNINAKKKRGDSKPKTKSTVSKKSYKAMEDNWGKKPAKKR